MSYPKPHETTQDLKPQELNKDIVASNLHHLYGFSPSTKITLLSGGTESAAWEINGKDTKWIAKVFGLREPVEWIEDEVNLYHYLNNYGIHAPVIRPSLSGKELSFICLKGYEFPLMVMRFETLRMCTPSTITQDELTRIAGAAARMHEILLNYPNKERLKERPMSAEWTRKDEPKSAFEALSQSVLARKFSQGQLNKFYEIDTQMEAYIKAHPPVLPLTESVIHGDLALEHAQLLPDRSVYVFDFSDRIWGPISQELGTFLATLYQWEDISIKRWDKLREWLLNGYQTITPLTQNDLNAIPREACVRLIGACKHLVQLAKDSPNRHVENWIRRGYELGEYLTR